MLISLPALLVALHSIAVNGLASTTNNVAVGHPKEDFVCTPEKGSRANTRCAPQ
jgi:hypothetical protein